MATEIERKFLVDVGKLSALTFAEEEKISQGYLSREPTVRVRLTGSGAWLTIKSSMEGITRKEFEYAIPTADAEELLKLCGHVLTKCRRKIFHGSHLWEIDFFGGRLAGLVVAEVELSAPDEVVDLPDWVTKEVSDDARYFNSNLVEGGLPKE
ncbi:MAG: CYTH domain-containing protein [Quinella sp. 2Q5]|nr:CYTH domain-containing protein [Quinella sp. 2Q5]